MDVVTADVIVELGGFAALILGLVMSVRRILGELRDTASTDAAWRARTDARLDHLDETIQRHERHHDDVLKRMDDIHSRINRVAGQ